MPKHFLLSLLTAAALMAALPARADEPFRDHRYDSWKVMTLPKDAIVFAGNSITDMHNWTEAFGNDPRIVNRGNSGGYSHEMLQTAETWARFKPAKVFIKIGTNDLGTGYTPEMVAGNVQRTVDIIRAESRKTEIYIQSILPARDQQNRTPATTQATNELLRKIAEHTPRTTYIDLYNRLGGILQGAPYSLDNLHMEALGYRIWCEALEPYLGGIKCIYPANTEQRQDTGGLGYSHGMRATYFSMQPVGHDDVLFFGDEMVKNGEWNELLHNPHVLNRGSHWGYGGDIACTSRFVDAAFANRDIVMREDPKQVLLYTGTADLNGKTPLEDIETQYKALIEKVRREAPTSKIALVSLMPTMWPNDRIPAFNKWLRETAAADASLSYIDIYTPLATPNGAANPAYFKANYIYGLGYAVISEVLARHIDGCTPLTLRQARKNKADYERRAAKWLEN